MPVWFRFRAGRAVGWVSGIGGDVLILGAHEIDAHIEWALYFAVVAVVVLRK